MLSSLTFLERQERGTKDKDIEILFLELLRRHQGKREITLEWRAVIAWEKRHAVNCTISITVVINYSWIQIMYMTVITKKTLKCSAINIALGVKIQQER